MEPIINALIGPCRDFFGYIMSLEKNVDSLAEEMDEMKSRKEKLKKEVQIAERWGQEPSISVKVWLNRAERLESDATLIHAEWGRRVRCLGDCSVNVCWSYHLSKRAEEKTVKAVALKSEYPLDELANQMVLARLLKMTGGPLIGRESVLQQLRHLVGDEKVGIIGIHGMGGVGKTALLESLHNEFLMEFAVIWIRTSKRVSVDEIQVALKNQLGLDWEGKNMQTERSIILGSALSRMKFMLFLDGLWEHLDINTVGIPKPDYQSGSKIILTTRLETVCDRMGAKKIKVECLAPEEAWDLFQQKAGKELIESNWQIRRYAKQLAKKCGGLPLALISIGHHMGSKETVGQWKHTVTSLNTTPWRMQGMVQILESLKLSYEELQDNKLRTCLLYASLLDENIHFWKVWIVDYCIGEGVIDDFDDPEVAYNLGDDLLGMLKASSLLEKGDKEDHLKMHPMIRNMVIWVECECWKQENKLLVRTGNSLEEAPDVQRWGEATRLSLKNNQIEALPDSPYCLGLLTLFLQENYGLTKIPEGFFQFMPNLKVLDLSHTSITELPAGIASLRGLQYLDLCGTPITLLPIELGGLINLRFLLLNFTVRLEIIPKGVLESLSALRVLHLYCSYNSWEVNSSGEGVAFEEIENLKKLRALGITLGTVSALQRLSRSRRLVTAMRELYLQSFNGLPIIQLPSTAIGRNMESLRRLTIENFCDLEEVIIGNGTVGHDGDEWSLLPCFEDLVLYGLPKAKIIWRSKSLQNLKIIWIWDCQRIERFLDCEDEEARGAEGKCEPFVAFPNLVEIQLDNLPEFRSLSIGGRALAFPSLRVLGVKMCPKLKKLILITDESVEITGEKKWWDALEWDNDNMNSSFCFKLQG